MIESCPLNFTRLLWHACTHRHIYNKQKYWLLGYHAKQQIQYGFSIYTCPMSALLCFPFLKTLEVWTLLSSDRKRRGPTHHTTLSLYPCQIPLPLSYSVAWFLGDPFEMGTILFNLLCYCDRGLSTLVAGQQLMIIQSLPYDLHGDYQTLNL